MGWSPANFGPEIHNIMMPEFAKILRRKNILVGEVLHIDGFGNIVTNFGETELEQMSTKTVINLMLKNVKLKLKLCKAYGEAKPQEPLALIGSHDYLEIALNQGNAAEKFKAKPGDRIKLSFA